MTNRYGAHPDAWAWWSGVLGLTEDLLPVVSNPSAKISRASGMRQLGKVPSRYNAQHEAVGFSGWTSYRATPADVTKWGRDSDIGICLQMRRIRALDVDVTDPEQASKIHNFVTNQVGILPCRMRSNASKFLLAFELATPGKQYGKRAFKTAGGIVEFLAAGQQAVVEGTHPSGVRYEWQGGLPDDIPSLTETQFEELWAALYKEFATSDSAETKPTERKEVLHEALASDPVAQALVAAGKAISVEKDGRVHLACPFADGHTDGETGGSSTTYFAAHTGGYERGHFDCKHASCSDRTDADFLEALGLAEDPADDFDVIQLPGPLAGGQLPGALGQSRFAAPEVADFAVEGALRWLVKGVVPDAELIVIYGAPGSGKSFFALDLAFCISRGEQWRGKKTAHGRVVYVCAEGALGFRNRVNAYSQYHGADLSSADMRVISDAPNFLKTDDFRLLIEALLPLKPIRMVVIDTLSRVMAGGDENSAKDMGALLERCKLLHRHTQAAVVLIHHSGKDTTKGARGHSSLLGAVDGEIEIIRDGAHRAATVDKLKDGADRAEFGFELETVVIGKDEDGDDITSCVVRPTDRAIVRAGQAREPKGDHERRVLRVVDGLVGLGDGQASVDEVLTACVNEMVYDKAAGGKDRRRFMCHRALDGLISRQRLVCRDGQISLPGGE